jgi:phosphatidylserine/phosphatidylglycerophosphate/cardiolipin synthase-like enzyme
MFKFLAFFCIICQGAIFCAASCEVYFSPQDTVAERFIQLVEAEKKSIRLAVYRFSHAKIARALKEAKERGVDVEVIVDPSSAGSRSPLHRLAEKVAVFVFDPPAVFTKRGKKKVGLMHDKFCIFGDQRVWTGSFNLTYDAERYNEENVVLIDDGALARKYLDRFRQLKTRSCSDIKKKSRKNGALAYTPVKEG